MAKAAAKKPILLGHRYLGHLGPCEGHDAAPGPGMPRAWAAGKLVRRPLDPVSNRAECASMRAGFYENPAKPRARCHSPRRSGVPRTFRLPFHPLSHRSSRRPRLHSSAATFSDGRRKEDASCVNPPAVLLIETEKVQPEPLAKLMPPSIAGSEWEPLARFGRVEGRTVLKPMHEAQSKGVELLDFRRRGDAEARTRIDWPPLDYKRPVILQTLPAGHRRRRAAALVPGRQASWLHADPTNRRLPGQHRRGKQHRRHSPHSRTG